MTKTDVVKLINDAQAQLSVPPVSTQKAEFYKLGVRDFIKEIQIQIDKIEEVK